MGSGTAVAIIFAGGIGSRMNGAAVPKQFMVVQGRPVLVHTLEHFERHGDVERIYVACLSTHIGAAWTLAHDFGLTKIRRIIPGGQTAQHSIFNALRCALDDGVPEDAVALIHDGVRPVISSALITRNIRCAEEWGSAITSIPCFETVAMSLDDARTVELVTQRDLMHVLQAPQTFRLGDAYRMNARSFEDGLLGKFVDQAHLMTHYGRRLRLVPGIRGNIKITTDYDILQFRLWVESGALPAMTGWRQS